MTKKRLTSALLGAEPAGYRTSVRPEVAVAVVHVSTGLQPAGREAEDIADLWWLMLVLSVITFTVVVGLLVAGLLRRPPGADREAQVQADTRAERTWLLGGGVAFPLVGLVIVMVATVAIMRETPTAADAEASGAPVIEVVGHQWYYEVTYPDHGVTVRDELHLALERAVVIEVTSTDVIHSFWVPSFGGKIDMLPGDTNSIVITPQREGEFVARCAELCGVGHTRMTMRVVVETQEELEDWLAEQS